MEPSSMEHHVISSRPPAPRPVAIEVDGEPLGVVIPADEGFRFLAVRLNAFAVEGQIFPTIDAARDAVTAAVHQEDQE
jgi:hypothetical protein